MNAFSEDKKKLFETEEQRIIEVYKHRGKAAARGQHFFVYDSRAHLHRIQERHRHTLEALHIFGLHEISRLRILDVGCGDGNMLGQFLLWGAHCDKLAGLELREDVAAQARRRLPLVDIATGSAAHCPWEDGVFDLVCVQTVFSSILNASLRQQVAVELMRVLRKDGAILWYDFFMNNPRNKNVRAVGANEVKALFPDSKIRLKRLTLAPPVAKLIPDNCLSVTYPVLAALPCLCTHYLGIIRK